MRARLIIFIIMLLAEAGLGYYALAINKGLFARFLFFLLSAGIISILVIIGMRYILPHNQTDSEDEEDIKEPD